ncbi:hypothetical protein [Patulibacter defluvii]|uniref:hypothetical protein n=1 Tax=Patulibacter defluvii TaxID=3095358 RepID=UPI002A76023A|nr:hypothetical protein [Patulibacter sp. DM4]
MWIIKVGNREMNAFHASADRTLVEHSSAGRTQRYAEVDVSYAFRKSSSKHPLARTAMTQIFARDLIWRKTRERHFDLREAKPFDRVLQREGAAQEINSVGIPTESHVDRIAVVAGHQIHDPCIAFDASYR